MSILKVDIQKLLGDDNIDIIIQNGINDKLPVRSIRIIIINYILRKFYCDPDTSELEIYPVSGKLIRPIKIKRIKSKHDYGYRPDLE